MYLMHALYHKKIMSYMHSRSRTSTKAI